MKRIEAVCAGLAVLLLCGCKSSVTSDHIINDPFMGLTVGISRQEMNALLDRSGLSFKKTGCVGSDEGPHRLNCGIRFRNALDFKFSVHFNREQIIRIRSWVVYRAADQKPKDDAPRYDELVVKMEERYGRPYAKNVSTGDSGGHTVSTVWLKDGEAVTVSRHSGWGRGAGISTVEAEIRVMGKEEMEALEKQLEETRKR